MTSRLTLAVLSLSLALALVGCGSPRESLRMQEQATGAPEAEKAPAQEARAGLAEDKAAAPGSALALPESRMVIKTAELSVRVRDVDSAFTRAVQLTEGSGGYVQSSTRSGEGGDSAGLTLRVPPDQFLPLIASLGSLGAEESKSISGQDVTEEYYDLDAELANKTQVRGRLLQLLDRAAKVSDAIQVEEQLERVGGDINRIKGRMKYLTTMVGLSTINLGIHSEARPRAEEFINWGFVGHGFVVAARALVRSLFFILQALVVVIPLAAIAGAAAWGIRAVIRRRFPVKGREKKR